MDKKTKNSDNNYRNQDFSGQEWAQKNHSERDPRQNSNQNYYYDQNYTYAAEASKKAQEAP